jgi:hypothetical protein
MVKHSEQYGPQFDPTDGTVGEIQLVKRWVVCQRADHMPAFPRQGRYTYDTQAEGDEIIHQMQAANSIKHHRWIWELETIEWWCWPTHLDPAYAVEHDKHFQEFCDAEGVENPIHPPYKGAFAFKWQRADGRPIDEEKHEDLREDALARITELVPQGYREGELVYTDDDGREYRGWWEIT